MTVSLLRSSCKRKISAFCFVFGVTLIPSSRAYYSMSFITERTGNGIITVSPKNEGDQSALVVISHGLGDSAEGFADVAEVRPVRILHATVIVQFAKTSPSRTVDACKRDAIRQIYSPNRTHTTRYAWPVSWERVLLVFC